MTSCLDGDDMNTPPGASKPFLEMTNNPSGGGNVNSGLFYFTGQTLTYPGTDSVGISTFAVALQGVVSYSKDINVTLTTPEAALDDYYSSDSLVYPMMPDSLFDFVNTTGVIKAGTTYAEFKVKFYPSKFDPIQNYMLPISATNDADLVMSSNFGLVYYHAIGNPIAGAYKWNYSRWNTGSNAGAPTTTATGSWNFLPDNATTIEVQSGYGNQNGFNVRYQLSFENNGGTLSNFKVKINPDDVKNNLTPAGIVLTQDATIIMADPVTGHYKFTYKVTNSAGGVRTLEDEYYK
jgi:hypothetical protein